MASSCEVLLDSHDEILAELTFEHVKKEALRIEQKFSRYRNDNIIFKINSSPDQLIPVDDETANLLDFAQHCYKISEGLFDITSGSLRRLWNFKEFKTFPDAEKIQSALTHVGFDQLAWQRPNLQLKKGMEIDFGGLAKEYAVDRCLAIAAQMSSSACLVNFGGDLSVHKTPKSGSWSVAIEEVFKNKKMGSQLGLKQGALATSGDTHRFFVHDEKKYSHILNPKTGLPVSNGIASITVHAGTCTMAGLLATISHLQDNPEEFLQQQGVQYWIVKN